MFLENLSVTSRVYKDDSISGASVDYTRTNLRRGQNRLRSWVDTRYIVKTVREWATRAASFLILFSERATIVVYLERRCRKFNNYGPGNITYWLSSRLLKHRGWPARLVQRWVRSWLGSIPDNAHPFSKFHKGPQDHGAFIPCQNLFPKYLHFAYLSPAVEANISLVVALMVLSSQRWSNKSLPILYLSELSPAYGVRGSSAESISSLAAWASTPNRWKHARVSLCQFCDA